jgi:hypothetical protein
MTKYIYLLFFIQLTACDITRDSPQDLHEANSDCIDARYFEYLAHRQLQLDCDSNLALLYYEKAFSLCKSYDPQIWLNAAELTFNKKDTFTALKFLKQAALVGNTFWYPYGNLLEFVNRDSLFLQIFIAVSDSVNEIFSQKYAFFDSVHKLDQEVRNKEQTYSEKVFQVDTAINRVLVNHIRKNGFPKSSELSHERLHHFFIIVFRHQMRDGNGITSNENFEMINKEMLKAIKKGELDPSSYAWLYDERSWSLDSVTYFGELKESMPDVKVYVEGIDDRRRSIGLPPIYLNADYWENHEAGFDWYKDVFLRK